MSVRQPDSWCYVRGGHRFLFLFCFSTCRKKKRKEKENNSKGKKGENNKYHSKEEEETFTFVHLVFLLSTFRSSVLEPNLKSKKGKQSVKTNKIKIQILIIKYTWCLSFYFTSDVSLIMLCCCFFRQDTNMSQIKKKTNTI